MTEFTENSNDKNVFYDYPNDSYWQFFFIYKLGQLQNNLSYQKSRVTFFFEMGVSSTYVRNKMQVSRVEFVRASSALSCKSFFLLGQFLKPSSYFVKRNKQLKYILFCYVPLKIIIFVHCHWPIIFVLYVPLPLLIHRRC